MLNNKKRGYHLTSIDRSSYFDWFYGYFEVSFEYKFANGNYYAGADQFALINNTVSLIDQ